MNELTEQTKEDIEARLVPLISNVKTIQELRRLSLLLDVILAAEESE
jgi:hypothetical protein